MSDIKVIRLNAAIETDDYACGAAMYGIINKNELVYFIIILILGFIASITSGQGNLLMADTASADNVSAVIASGSETDSGSGDYLDLSLEELVEMPVVVTASRAAYQINKSTIPISIITAEDIHYSGLTSISDILRFAPGMDVLPNRRGFTVSAVRGFHDNLSERTLVLIDGRPMNNPYYGGSDYFRFPISTQDIERIEILRGPGGAAWGANAFTGVVNIITRKPQKSPEVISTTTITEFNDIYNSLQYSFGNDTIRNRFSLNYNDIVSSAEAGYGDVIFRNESLGLVLNRSDYYDKDFFRQSAFNYGSNVTLTEDNILDYGVGYSDVETGSIEFLGIPSVKDFYARTLISHVKLEHKFDEETSAYIQCRYDRYEMFNMSAANYKSDEFGLDGQYSFVPFDDHESQFGADLHFSDMKMNFVGDTQTKFDNDHNYQYQAGAFVIDRWKYDDYWTFEGQFRGDYFSENKNELGSRLTALRFLDEGQSRALRFSAGRSYRTPMIFLRGSSQAAIYLAPNLYYTNLSEADDLKNEKIVFFEAGYQQTVIDNTVFNINSYYQQMDDMIGLRLLDDPLGLGRRFTQFYNQGKIGAYGVECDLERRFKYARLSVWFAYNDIQNRYPEQDFRSYSPSKYKTGLSWRYFINDYWVVNSNYQYAGQAISYSDIPDIEPNHRLDISISRKFNNNKGEFMIGVSDIINSDNNAHLGFGQFTANTTPGRMFFARLQLKF